MAEQLHIWVGSDVWQRDAGAERVLEYTIDKHATCDFDIHWMRAGDPGFEVNNGPHPTAWNIGHEPGVVWPKKGWGTTFSCFRFAIPELMGFTGRAVYMDADMLVLGDVKELLELPTPKPWVTCHHRITDVSVLDCAGFRIPQWPSIAQMRPEGRPAFYTVELLNRLGLISATLPWDWNCRDSNDEIKPSTRLLHYTTVPWQPYHPYPTVKYMPHPKPGWVRMWFDAKAEADAVAG